MYNFHYKLQNIMRLTVHLYDADTKFVRSTDVWFVQRCAMESALMKVLVSNCKIPAYCAAQLRIVVQLAATVASAPQHFAVDFRSGVKIYLKNVFLQ